MLTVISLVTLQMISSDTSGVTAVHLHGPPQLCMSVGGTVHDGVLALSGLRDIVHCLLYTSLRGQPANLYA